MGQNMFVSNSLSPATMIPLMSHNLNNQLHSLFHQELRLEGMQKAHFHLHPSSLEDESGAPTICREPQDQIPLSWHAAAQLCRRISCSELYGACSKPIQRMKMPLLDRQPTSAGSVPCPAGLRLPSGIGPGCHEDSTISSPWMLNTLAPPSGHSFQLENPGCCLLDIFAWRCAS